MPTPPKSPPLIPTKEGGLYKVPAELLRELRETYYDVDATLQTIRLWSLTNPSKRKTARGMPRFIVGWLEGWGGKYPSKRRPMCFPLMALAFESRPISPEQKAANQRHVADLRSIIKGAK